MSCNSAIYTSNTSNQEVAVNSQIPFGSVIRRFGKYVNLVGSDVVIGDACSKDGNGYYKCNCSVTLLPGATGSVTAQLYLNGQPYEGAIASQYAETVDEPVNISFSCLVRLWGCCPKTANLQVWLSGVAGNIVSMPFTVEKL